MADYKSVKEYIYVNHNGPHQISNTSEPTKNVSITIRTNSINHSILKRAFSENIHNERGELCWTSLETTEIH